MQAKRLAAYLAGELRGQLLQREARLEIRDGVARGRAQKLLVVKPQRYRGIPLPEIDPATMESRVCRGLYVIGEMLDVDGRIGGFNFQWAWSSGRLAGLSSMTSRP